MQIRLDDYQAPLATPIGNSKFCNCDFEREKKYFSLKLVTRVHTGDINLFKADTDIVNDSYYTNYIITDISYPQLLQSVCNNGFLIDFIKIQYATAGSASYDDIDENISVVWYDGNGETCTYPLIPRNSQDPYQRQASLIHIDLRRTPILLDGNTYLVIPAIHPEPIFRVAATEITMVFQYRKRILKSDTLKLINALT